MHMQYNSETLDLSPGVTQDLGSALAPLSSEAISPVPATAPQAASAAGKAYFFGNFACMFIHIRVHVHKTAQFGLGNIPLSHAQNQEGISCTKPWRSLDYAQTSDLWLDSWTLVTVG